MSELRIVRGRDIHAAINGVELFGVTELDVTGGQKLHYVKEFLSSTPCAVLHSGCSYGIRLKTLSLFSYQIPMDKAFTLSVLDEEMLYIFEQCRVVKRHTNAQGDSGVKEVFQIEAQRMREQEIEDE